MAVGRSTAQENQHTQSKHLNPKPPEAHTPPGPFLGSAPAVVIDSIGIGKSDIALIRA